MHKDYDGYVIIGTVLDTEGLDDGIEDMQKESKLKTFINSISSKFKQMFANSKKLTKKLGLDKIGKKIAQLGVIAIKTMSSVLLSAAKFGIVFLGALGVIGLIIAGLAIVAGAVKKVGEEHKELKEQLQYIIFAIKTALQPAIDWFADKLVKIIQFLIKILTYAMALANVLAGRNLFEKADAKAFADYMKKAEKNSKGVASNAAKTRKQLTAIDEMNVLQDNVTGSGGTSNTIDLGFQDVIDNLPDYEKKD